MVAWVPRQRLRYPDPEPGARLRAVEDIRRVTKAHAHLLDDFNDNGDKAVKIQ